MTDHPIPRRRGAPPSCAVAATALCALLGCDIVLAQAAATSADRVSPGTRDGQAQSFNVRCGDGRRAMVVVNEDTSIICYYPPGKDPTCGEQYGIADAATLACGGQPQSSADEPRAGPTAASATEEPPRRARRGRD